MNAVEASKNFMDSNMGRLVGAAAVTAIVSKIWPFMVVENNKAGFKRRFGKVDHAIVPTPDSAGRMQKIIRTVRPDRSGTPLPDMVGPGLHFKLPFSHSIEVVSVQPRTTKLGIIQVDRKQYELRSDPESGESRPVETGKVQSDVVAEVGWRVSPLGFNPYRAYDEVDDIEAAVTRICRGAVGKATRSIDDIGSAKLELLTNVVNYHAYEQLLKIGVELLYVNGISDVRSFGEMVQPPEGSPTMYPSPGILATRPEAPDLHVA